MTVLYDYQGLYPTFSGISKCFFELIHQLPPEVNFLIGLRECDNLHLQRLKVWKVDSCRHPYEKFFPAWKSPLRKTIYDALGKSGLMATPKWVNRKESVRLMKEGEWDVFHVTGFDPYFLPYLNGKPFVMHIHDLTAELFPQYFPSDDIQIRGRKILCDKAAHIVCVSQNTLEDAHRILGIPREKMSVIYHGAPYEAVEDKSPVIPFKYILYVGNRGMYKNFLPMLRSLKPVLDRHSDLKLVCTGGAFDTCEETEITRLGLRDRIWQQRVTDEELTRLYLHAELFIYPSLYEGFGIPILEAWHAGCPVFLNRKSCFPEVAGDAAVWFELDDEHDTLADAVENWLASPQSEKDALTARQSESMKRFSWEQSARQLADVYHQVLTQSRR